MSIVRTIAGDPATVPAAAASWRRLRRVRRVAVELTPQAIEQIAQRVADLLRAGDDELRSEAPVGLLDAEQLAKHLGLNRGWIYQHAAELGALRVGKGPRARLRFDLTTVIERLAPFDSEPAPPSPGLRPRTPQEPIKAPRTPDPPAPLLPITPRRVRGVRGRVHSLRRIRGW